MMKKNYFSNLKNIGKLATLAGSLLISSIGNAQDLSNGLKLHYDFDPATVSGTTVPDASGNGYAGTLYGATVGLSNGKNSLILSTSGSDYLDMGASTGNLVASLNDFSMACYVWVNTTYATLGNNGNMIATFANSLDSYANSDGYMFLQAKRSRYSITTARYETEQAAQTGVDVVKGQWVQFTYTQKGDTGRFYVNGVLKNTNPAITLKPSNLGATPYNMLAKPSYTGDAYLQDAQLSDFRIYDRAVTSDEVLMLNGYSSTIITAYNALNFGALNLSAVTADLTLPATSNGLNVSWKTSNALVIDTDGKVTRPEQYDATVKLTATIYETIGQVTDSLVKEFAITVKSFNVTADQLAEWDFDGSLIHENNGSVTVTDKQSGFVGTVMNDARIRTIGQTTQYNVLDLGNGTGYFDMGTEIGKAIYSLNNYSICGYFRIDGSYGELNSNGNFYWTFSNSNDIDTDKNGYIIGSLKSQTQSISTNYWNAGNQAVGVGTNAPVDGWHHIAYTQNGTTGTIYVDGVQAATGLITNLPSTAITIAGRTGTLYNWLGRSNYKNDVYLRKTLLYDFQLLSVPLTADDLNFGFEVPATIDNLNFAYTENPDYLLPELTAEMNNLDLGDLSAVTSNLTLPTTGTLDNTISITWKSSNDSLITSAGVVTRPNYYSYKVTLTASLTKNGQKTSKTFPATVVVKDGTQYSNDLLVKYDFSSVQDSVVTDAAEKHLKGVMKNGASIKTIGTTTQYKVLSLGDSIGYFDMGTEVGNLMYNLNDYTVGAYYRIDTSYTEIGSNGNFLWNFSNSKDILSTPTGYIIGSLRNQAATITPNNWNGEQTVALGTAALQGSWHYFGYTQSGTTGTVYIDGEAMAVGDVTDSASVSLKKDGLLGTLYNWIGRSCYTGDVYLRKALVYDFRLYRTALTAAQIQTSELNVANTISALDAAYDETPNALKSIINSRYKVYSTIGNIRIQGLTGTEKVSVFDISGRQLKFAKPDMISVNQGIYIVRIDDYVSKLVVR